MPSLRCDANTCAHNKSQACCLNGISVGGKSATKDSSTACISFAENDGAMTNAAQEPVFSMEIGCEAKNCVHNHSCTCGADSVSINGNAAHSSQETQCSSFACK